MLKLRKKKGLLNLYSITLVHSKLLWKYVRCELLKSNLSIYTQITLCLSPRWNTDKSTKLLILEFVISYFLCFWGLFEMTTRWWRHSDKTLYMTRVIWVLILSYFFSVQVWGKHICVPYMSSHVTLYQSTSSSQQQQYLYSVTFWLMLLLYLDTLCQATSVTKTVKDFTLTVVSE